MKTHKKVVFDATFKEKGLSKDVYNKVDSTFGWPLLRGSPSKKKPHDPQIFVIIAPTFECPTEFSPTLQLLNLILGILA